jgi:hypothetical protein
MCSFQSHVNGLFIKELCSAVLKTIITGIDVGNVSKQITV